MNIVEYAISLLAPHACLVCRKEGSPVCLSCMATDITAPLYTCYRCAASVTESYVCASCSKLTGISYLAVSASYAGLAKDMLAMLKFQRAKAVGPLIGDWMDSRLPTLNRSLIIAPVPTVPARVRARGYDQASLIAKRYAFKAGVQYSDILMRQKYTRQIGASRSERFQQLDQAFVVRNPEYVRNKHILIIDDVLTTGATLESAARTLLDNGALAVSAAVFAYQPKAS